MNRIDTLQIHNFKFFQAQKPIKLGGNHLLLYGENGSGKSSIYWALYTLFEASLKSNTADIRKYFSKVVNKKESLINIHAVQVAGGKDNYNSFIEVITDDPIPVKYKIAINKVKIKDDKKAQEINYASDYINYRLLMSLSAFRHSYDIDLFEMFVEDVFKYVQFSKVEITRDGKKMSITNAFEIWQQIEKGLEMVDSVKSKTPRKILAYKGSGLYIEFTELIKSFNESLQKLIDYINIHGPAYFEKLGYDIPYSLHLERKADFKKGDKEYEEIPFVLRIKIEKYEGLNDVIDKPHSFLNEAKLSALSISIRLAILSQKLKENCLKFIVLDDLLISLDMSNREKVLDVLLSPEFSTNYQLIILSHDFSFFQLCKRRIADANQTNWVFKEMYVDEDNKLPVLLSSDTSYAKACNHLKSFDYPAAGNYFRKATEEIFENNFPREVTIADSGEKRTTLKGYLDAAIKFYERIGYNDGNLKILDNYLFLLLNPLSHRATDTNVYKTELNRVKSLLPKIIEEVRNLNFRELVAANSNIVISFTQDANTQFEYFIKTIEPIYIFKNAGQDVISNSKCKSYESSTITNGSAPVVVKNERYDFNSLEMLHQDIYTKKMKPYDNSLMSNIFHEAHQSKQRTSLGDLLNAL